MPKKSAAALSVVSIDEHRTRIPAPAHLPLPIRHVFDEITASVAVRHLRISDAPLIEALAVAIHNNRQATAAIEREGLVVDGRMNAHVGVVDRTAKLIASLSVKLRLGPSTRLDRKTAGATTREESLPSRVDDEGVIDALLALDDEEDEA